MKIQLTLADPKVLFFLDACNVGHKLFISDSGERALLVVNRAQIYLWELSEESGMPQWWRIAPPEGVLLPQNCNKEASIDACFHVHPVSESNTT